MPNSNKLDDAAAHGLNQPFIEEVTNHITSTEDSFIEEPTVSNNKNLLAYPKSGMLYYMTGNNIRLLHTLI